MDFIRLVEVAAAQAPAARPTAEFSDQDLPPAILRLQEQVARLRNAGDERDPTQTDQTGLTLCQLLLNVVSERLSKRRALSRKR